MVAPDPNPPTGEEGDGTGAPFAAHPGNVDVA